MNIEIGIVPALITPLNEDETIDVPSLENLINWMLGYDLKGLFVGGTMAEGIALRDSQRAILFRESVRIVNGRVPILANVSEISTKRALDNVTMAVEAKVDAVVATPRMVFPSRTPGETFRFMKVLTENSAVPVWFYENPYVTPFASDFESIAEFMSLPNMEGLKFSAQNFELFARCVRELPNNTPCFNGSVREIAKSAKIGGGTIAGIGSMLPGLCVAVFKAALAERENEAKKYQEAINSAYSIYGGDGMPLWPSAQKHVLMRRGLIKTNMSTEPFQRLNSEQERMVDEALEKIEDWVFEPAAV